MRSDQSDASLSPPRPIQRVGVPSTSASSAHVPFGEDGSPLTAGFNSSPSSKFEPLYNDKGKSTSAVHDDGDDGGSSTSSTSSTPTGKDGGSSAGSSPIIRRNSAALVLNNASIAHAHASHLQFRDFERKYEEEKKKLLESDAAKAERSHSTLANSLASSLFGVREDEDEDEPTPQVVSYRRSEQDDGYSYTRIGQGLTYCVEPIYFGVKAAAMVSLPLCILSFDHKVNSHFKAGSLLAVIGTANCQLFLGVQLSSSIIILQAALWSIILGTFLNAIGVPHHESAWWCFAFAQVLFVSFFTNLRSRRVMMSYGMIIMQMQRTIGGDAINHPVNFGGDLALAVCFAVLQSLFPYPLLMTRKTDRVFAGCWKNVGKIIKDLRTGVWSGRTHSGYVMLSQAACDELEGTVDSIPNLLFLCMYEPFEASLYNQLRNVRLTLLRRLLVLLHAACTSARMVTAMTTPDVFEDRRKMMELLHEPLHAYFDALSFTLTELGKSLEPSYVAANCKFEELVKCKDAVSDCLQNCVTRQATKNGAITDAPVFYSFIYFHLLIMLLAEELNSFGEQMANFNPRQYKSTWRRFLEFFILDFWNDFRHDLPRRLLLRTEADRRSFKEGLKLACAYCVAAAFTLKLNTDHKSDTYYFGMSIILGIGLPTPSESIEVGIQRIAGMAFALAIGYLAKWKTHTFPQAMALLVCGSCVCICLRSAQRYMQVAYYASFIAPAAYGIAHDKATMISRVVDNSFAVISFFIINAFMFPINPFRVLWNSRSVADKTIAELITQLSEVSAMPINAEYDDIAQAKLLIAAEKVKVVRKAMGESGRWAAICANEPVIVGKPFPTTMVHEMRRTKLHLVAGLEIWLFGQQLLRRQREESAHPLVQRMVRTLRPILKDVEAASRVVLQDLIDAVELPTQWTIEKSWRHFSDFVLITSNLNATFQELHNSIMQALQPSVRRRSVGDALVNGIDSFLRMGNRSFVSTAIIAPDPHNVRSAPDYGALDTVETHMPPPDPATATTTTVAAEAAASHTPGGELRNFSITSTVTVPITSAPMPSPAPFNRSFMENRILVNDSSLSQALQQMRPTQMSFTAPVSYTPIDVDVTAITMVIVSINALVDCLQQLVPNTARLNDFERSRRQRALRDVKDFFMC